VLIIIVLLLSLLLTIILLMAFDFFINFDWYMHQKDNHKKIHIIWTNCTAFNDMSSWWSFKWKTHWIMRQGQGSVFDD